MNRAAAERAWRDAPAANNESLTRDDIIWALGSLSALSSRAFDAELLARELQSPPLHIDALIRGARSLGFRIKQRACTAQGLRRCALPCLTMLREAAAQELGEQADSSAAVERTNAAREDAPRARLAIVIKCGDADVLLFRAGTNRPVTLAWQELEQQFSGVVFNVALAVAALKDPDGASGRGRPFGFRWFVPELLKHKTVWRDVLIASLLIQILALTTPLFTQVVIDKVLTDQTRSTLVVIAIGMGIFVVFTGILSWLRQYLVLHTGNRVDAVLGAAVFEHILKLPPRYFEARPTGVITARLRGVENIREFVASAAVTLVLDLPFLLVFVAIMLTYSLMLTMIALGLVGVIIALSLAVAPIFRSQLNEQFLLGARNQALATEYIAGLETVKSLQMEPQVRARYNDYLAEYLRSGFSVRQIANTYNVFANGLEQTLGVLVLVMGATLVMRGGDFTIGMLVAFQMFASRVSEPLLRLVGLWQQFQQATLSIARLGDIMNATPEPYSLVPRRTRDGRGLIEMEELGFRYGESLPWLFRNFNLRLEPGKVIAVMGPSGCGKSTLAKLLQGLYRTTEGRIKLDGHDIGYLAANELRLNFGVVPQETVLFSGSVYDNLLTANPHATFEQIVEACRIAEIHEAIEKLPEGYQTELGERGVGLSGGQRQRIAIARALLKRPRILIFDEATSSLDLPTAEHFCATVNQLKGRVTILFIAHAVPRTLQIDEVVRMGGPTPVAAGEALKAEPRVAAL